MEFKVSLTPRARRNLASIWKFIARDDSETATKFFGDLARHAYTLTTFPDRMMELPSRRTVRKIPSGAYLIFTRSTKQPKPSKSYAYGIVLGIKTGFT